MTTERGVTSPQLERVIRQLARVYEVDLSRPGASFALELPSRTHRWLITNLDGTRMSVTRCVVEEDNCLGLELDMVFLVQPLGWEPVELVHTSLLWEEYVQTAQAADISVYYDNGDPCFANFTEYWARQLQHQGWLTQALKVEQVKWTEEVSGRLASCQSTHPGPCYGELWQCASCGKSVCCAEGSDNHPEVCDDCWVKHDDDQEESNVPF
jgi:hypothetical protein